MYIRVVGLDSTVSTVQLCSSQYLHMRSMVTCCTRGVWLAWLCARHLYTTPSSPLSTSLTTRTDTVDWRPPGWLRMLEVVLRVTPARVQASRGRGWPEGGNQWESDWSSPGLRVTTCCYASSLIPAGAFLASKNISFRSPLCKKDTAKGEKCINCVFMAH